MDFKPLIPAVIAKSVPTIKANANTVVIGIPNHIADQVGLTARTKVELGVASKAKQTFVSVTPKPDSHWAVTQRPKTRQIFASELKPKAPPARALEMVYRVLDGRLILTLPDGWELAQVA